MSLDQFVDISVAIGKGVYSVGEDLVYGIERTTEGLGARGWTRIEDIGEEDQQIVKLIIDAFKYPFEEKGPLYRAIKIILLEYYKNFPEDALRRIAEKAGIAVGFLAGRMLIGRQVAASVSRRVLIGISASEGFKKISTRLGISVTATASGVGTLVGLLMLQGAAQRASNGRKELEETIPSLSKLLKKEGNLDLLYFLIKNPMKKHLQGIIEAKKYPSIFEEEAKRVHVR